MNQQNKKVAIVLAGDEKLDFAIANVIIGLKRYNESLIDRVFVYTDMPQEKRDKISLIWRDKIAFVAFGYEDFERIRPLMPWAVTLQFQNKRCVSIQECPLAPSPKKAL